VVWPDPGPASVQHLVYELDHRALDGLAALQRRVGLAVGDVGTEAAVLDRHGPSRRHGILRGELAEWADRWNRLAMRWMAFDELGQMRARHCADPYAGIRSCYAGIRVGERTCLRGGARPPCRAAMSRFGTGVCGGRDLGGCARWSE
jgi:hypothetical protein